MWSGSAYCMPWTSVWRNAAWSNCEVPVSSPSTSSTLSGGGSVVGQLWDSYNVRQVAYSGHFQCWKWNAHHRIARTEHASGPLHGDVITIRLLHRASLPPLLSGFRSQVTTTSAYTPWQRQMLTAHAVSWGLKSGTCDIRDSYFPATEVRLERTTLPVMIYSRWNGRRPCPCSR